MTTHDVIPAKDGDFDDFQDNLVSRVNINQAPWNIPPAEITPLQNAQAIWSAAWLIAKNKSNRTRAQVEAKDDARDAYVPLLRPFIQKWIVRNTSMTDADRETCGVHPRDTVKTPIGKPTTVPQVDTKPERGHVVKIFFKQEPDENGISKRGKPKGVAQIGFVYTIGGTPPATPEQCPQRGVATRSPRRVQFEVDQKGMTVYFFACWLNAKGEAGPWTERQDFLIP